MLDNRQTEQKSARLKFVGCKVVSMLMLSSCVTLANLKTAR